MKPTGGQARSNTQASCVRAARYTAGSGVVKYGRVIAHFALGVFFAQPMTRDTLVSFGRLQK
jgi:hypothetical protein